MHKFKQYLTLLEFTNEYCEGNKAKAGRAFGYLPQAMSPKFRDPDKWAVLIDGKKLQLVEVRKNGRLL